MSFKTATTINNLRQMWKMEVKYCGSLTLILSLQRKVSALRFPSNSLPAQKITGATIIYKDKPPDSFVEKTLTLVNTLEPRYVLTEHISVKSQTCMHTRLHTDFPGVRLVQFVMRGSTICVSYSRYEPTLCYCVKHRMRPGMAREWPAILCRWLEVTDANPNPSSLRN